MTTLDFFTKCLYMLAFDLKPDRESDEEHISLPRQGNVRFGALLKNYSPNV